MIGLTDEEIQEVTNKYKAVWEIDGKKLSKVEILQRQHARLRAPVQEQLRRVAEWGSEVCTEHTHMNYDSKVRRECCYCWQLLLKEVKNDRTK